MTTRTHLCDCGLAAVRVKNNCHVCARCDALEQQYHAQQSLNLRHSTRNRALANAQYITPYHYVGPQPIAL